MSTPNYFVEAYTAAHPALAAVARYNGPMTAPGLPALHLWTLLTPLPGLLVGSTYAEATLIRALCLVGIQGATGPMPEPLRAIGPRPSVDDLSASRLPLYVTNAGD